MKNNREITYNSYLLLFGLYDTLKINTNINYTVQQCKRYTTYSRMGIDTEIMIALDLL